MERYNRSLAYIVGVALGDGNLSNPNKRAVRLRVTCDAKYPRIIKRIIRNIKIILPNNQVSPVIRSKQNCVDVSCYSNQWEKLLGWKAKKGSKSKQKISVPKWIQKNQEFTRLCLKGLFETDGSVYLDRGYTMVNFVSIIPTLVRDVENMIHSIGFISNTQKFKEKTGSIKHTIRVSKNAKEFIKKIQLNKS